MEDETKVFNIFMRLLVVGSLSIIIAVAGERFQMPAMTIMGLLIIVITAICSLHDFFRLYRNRQC